MTPVVFHDGRAGVRACVMRRSQLPLPLQLHWDGSWARATATRTLLPQLRDGNIRRSGMLCISTVEQCSFHFVQLGCLFDDNEQGKHRGLHKLTRLGQGPIGANAAESAPEGLSPLVTRSSLVVITSLRPHVKAPASTSTQICFGKCLTAAGRDG